MSGRFAKVAAGVAGMLALGGVTAASASAAPAPSWHIVKSVRNGADGDFSAVVATGRSTGWAFNGSPGETGAPSAWQRHGSSWTRVSFPGKRGETVVAAGATSPSDVWAFTDLGAGSRVLRWNGRAWSVVTAFGSPIGGAAVIAGNDVWVFGQPGIIEQLGAWHYNGRSWSRVARNLDGGSAVAPHDVWAVSGTNVDHWNGRAWASTSVKGLLPRKQMLNFPLLTGIYAQSAHSVYAIGNGDLQDEGGPTVVLHYDGHRWSRVAEGSFGFGTQPSQQISSDGHGGLWLPMPGTLGAPSHLVHYAGGKLTPVALPAGGRFLSVESVSRIPGTTQVLAGGFTHARDDLSRNVVAVILQYS